MNCKACGGFLVETATRGSAGWYTIHQCAMCGRSPENMRRVDENLEIDRIRKRAKALTNGDPIKPWEEDVEIKTPESTDQNDINDSSTYQASKPATSGVIKESTCEKTLTVPVPDPVSELVDEPASEPVPEPSVNSLPEEASHIEKEIITVDSLLKEAGQELRNWRLNVAGLSGLELASRLRHPKTKRPPHASAISAWELGKQAIPDWAREQMTKIRGWNEKKDSNPSPSRDNGLDAKEDAIDVPSLQSISPISPERRDEFYCEIPLATLEAFTDLARTLAPLGWEKLTICRR